MFYIAENTRTFTSATVYKGDSSFKGVCEVAVVAKFRLCKTVSVVFLRGVLFFSYDTVLSGMSFVNRTGMVSVRYLYYCKFVM